MRFEKAQIVWLGSLAPQWAYEIKNQRDIVSGKPDLPFNGYGRILTQFDDIVELQVMVGQPNGCWDARVFRCNATDLERIQTEEKVLIE